MKLANFAALVALCLFVSTTANADVPKLINYQGRLTNTVGVPVPNSTYPVTFTIYDAAAGGSNLWSETNSVTTSSGLFAVLLGNNVALPNGLFSDTTRYIGIQVSADPELIPRQRLVSSPYSYRVSTVDGASGGTITSKVSIGPGHINTGTDAFVAGNTNTVSGYQSTVGGGYGNNVSGHWSTISGGENNTASGTHSTVAGGVNNTATSAAAVGGGFGHQASGIFSTIGGGETNTGSANYTTVGGGGANTASSNYATVGGGNRNIASQQYATVSGGADNTASLNFATVGGGSTNNAIGILATVGGGLLNIASGITSTVGGGDGNVASGLRATVPGGFRNTALGSTSFAAGLQAKANHDGAFVWGDATFDDFASTASNQFLIRAAGGVGIGTNAPQGLLHLYSSANPTVMRIQSDGTPGFGRIEFVSNPQGSAFEWRPSYIQSTDNGGFTGGLAFYVNGSGPLFGSVEVMRIVNGQVGIGTTTPAALLHVNGSAGNNTGVWSNLSDRRLKRDIEPIQNALETVNQLQPVSFRWKDAKKDAEYGRVRGLIAQDVEKILPEWVKTDPDGYKRLEPIGVDVLLIEAIKEQQKQIDELKAEISKLKNQSPQAQVETNQKEGSK